MIWEQKKNKALKNKEEISWIVVRNRLSFVDAINKRKVGFAIEQLGKRLGFSVAPGFGDRVIFKELFLSGFTLLDTRNTNKIKMTPSIIAARQELREFATSLNLTEVNKKL